MNIVLLNWKNGENDPFSFFNQQLQYSLTDIGCEVNIIEIDDTLEVELLKISSRKKIHAAITHQGLATSWKLQNSDQLIWDELKLKLISLHGDHPCLAPSNHVADSKYVIHAYSTPEFCSYANRFFHRNYPAILLNHPFFANKSKNISFKSGDFFVLPKNLDDKDSLFSSWKQNYPAGLSNFLIDTSEEICNNFLNGDPIDHHEIINRCLSDEKFNELKQYFLTNDELEIFHNIHGMLDKIYRNSVSESIIYELRDLPLLISGRGWQKFEKRRNPKHKFVPFSKVADGDSQFDTNFGIIDVVPIRKSLHDRTVRALANNGGFLSNSKLYDNDWSGDKFRNLFYSGASNDLRTKAENVMSAPKKHLDLCQDFGIEISAKHSIQEFYNFIYTQSMIN